MKSTERKRCSSKEPLKDLQNSNEKISFDMNRPNHVLSKNLKKSSKENLKKNIFKPS